MMPLSSKQDRSKRMAAARAIEEVEDGMILGLGSGSTAAFAVEALAARIAKGLRVVGIPTIGAVRSLNLANAAGIAMWEALRQSGALDQTFTG